MPPLPSRPWGPLLGGQPGPGCPPSWALRLMPVGPALTAGCRDGRGPEGPPRASPSARQGSGWDFRKLSRGLRSDSGRGSAGQLGQPHTDALIPSPGCQE